MLMRFDPFTEFDRLTRETFGSRQPVMPMDAFRHGDHVVIRLDLPGVRPESIEVTVERNVLNVRAERGWEPQEGDEIVVAERPQGTFSRQLFLGDSLDAERLEARYEDGVLTVTVPVAEAAKPRRIAVSVGAGNGHSIGATSTGALAS